MHGIGSSSANVGCQHIVGGRIGGAGSIVVAVREQRKAHGLCHCITLVLADGVLQDAAQLVGPVLVAQQQLYIVGDLQRIPCNWWQSCDTTTPQMLS